MITLCNLKFWITAHNDFWSSEVGHHKRENTRKFRILEKRKFDFVLTLTIFNGLAALTRNIVKVNFN